MRKIIQTAAIVMALFPSAIMAQDLEAGFEVKDNFWVVVLGIVILLVWFLVHFIWTFKIYKWLFAMEYESPWAYFAARFWWAASWIIIPILIGLAGSG